MTVGGEAPLTGAQLIINIDAAIAAIAGLLFSGYTNVGNVGGGTDDLITYSLPANTLNSNGKGVRIRAWGTGAANANGKTLALWFGGVAIAAASLGNGDKWSIDAVVLRSSGNHQRYSSLLFRTSVAAPVVDSGTTMTETDTAGITIKCTGGATTTNDIVQEGMIVEALR